MRYIFNLKIEIIICIVAFVSFIITYVTIPTLVRMSKFKKLFDIVDSRKVHTEEIARLGGMGIFAGLTISILLLVNPMKMTGLGGVSAGLIILFFVGLKDDILVISPLTKMIGQIIAASIIIVFGNTLITNFHGFFGINEINRVLGFFVTLFVFLITTNAFNFIDGVDGLSASLGMVASLAMGVWFYLVGEYQYVIVAVALLMALAAFVRYNLFSKRNKIFMGDTGSMLIGFMLSFLVVHFMEADLILDKTADFYILPAPAVAFSVMIIPYFDMLRVIYIRILRKRSIFYPDKNHMHHLLLDIGLSHKQITFALTSVTILFILFVYWLSQFVTIRRLFLLELILAMFISFVPEVLVKRKRKKMGK